LGLGPVWGVWGFIFGLFLGTQKKTKKSKNKRPESSRFATKVLQDLPPPGFIFRYFLGTPKKRKKRKNKAFAPVWPGINHSQHEYF